MRQFFRFRFIKRKKRKYAPLTPQQMADYIKSKNDLVLANKELQEVIKQNHFSLNIRKALNK